MATQLGDDFQYFVIGDSDFAPKGQGTGNDVERGTV